MRLALALILLASAAQAKPPAPDFYVKSLFQERLVHVAARACPAIELNHAGIDRHRLATIARLSDMKIHARTVGERFAPIHASRYDRHMDAFLNRHGLNVRSDMTLVCIAIQDELAQRSPVGLMVKPAAVQTGEE